MKWTSLAAPLALSLGLVVPSGALAAGGPVPPVQGSQIGVPGSPFTYTAIGAGPDTVVRQVVAGSATTVAAIRVSGRYGVPGVDFSGTTTGLSADGHTLVLAALAGNYPPRATRLIVLDTPRLVVRARVVMPGWSTVDAISPDGHWLYLLQYSSSNISDYAVRAYDLVGHRLLATPVVAASDRGEAMTGFPITRVMSADGRWAYTFYARPSGVPFIHALDTAARRAECIDLPSLASADFGTAQLDLISGGGVLRVSTDRIARVLINTRTFAVSLSASAPRSPKPPKQRSKPGRDGPPWGLIVLAIAALAVLAATFARFARPGRRRGLARVRADGS
jgi:hypothetical protein